MFGWSLPPGCTLADIDAAFGDEEEWPEEAPDEDDEVTGGYWYSDQGDYAGGAPADLGRDDLESEVLHERMAQDNPALATAEEVALMDLYDNM